MDDPRKSLDSNTYGPVSISLITGRVIAVLWPRPRLLRWWEWDRTNPEAGSGVDLVRERGEGYRNSVRERVVKEAIKVDRPSLD